MSTPMLLSIEEVTPADPAVLETHRRLAQRARRLAWFGLGWHVVEATVAIGAGFAAGSVALLGFGGDSLIEASAGLVVLWRFAEGRLVRASAERRSQRLIALSFYLLAIYIAVEAVASLAGGSHPAVSWIGIGLAAATLVTMPPLASAKGRVAQSLGSSAATSESRQSMLCAYLSAGLLVGLGLNALAGWWWADPATALMISAVAVREGRDAWQRPLAEDEIARALNVPGDVRESLRRLRGYKLIHRWNDLAIAAHAAVRYCEITQVTTDLAAGERQERHWEQAVLDSLLSDPGIREDPRGVLQIYETFDATEPKRRLEIDDALDRLEGAGLIERRAGRSIASGLARRLDELMTV